MKRDRGEYRPIYEVLLDGPDWQQLSADARLAFLSLKLKCGVFGIKVVPGLVSSLSQWCGFSQRRAKLALDYLQTAQWIDIDGSVVWVIRGLEFEPTIDASNINHRKYLERVLSSLPSLAIVDRFRARYAAWVGKGISNPIPDPTPKGSPIPMPITTTTTTTTPSSTAPPKRAKKPRAVGPVENWVSALGDWWTENIGTVNYGQLGNHAKSHHFKRGDDAIKRAALRYFGPAGKTGYRSAADFFATFAQWDKATDAPTLSLAKDQPESPSDRLRRMGAL